MENTGIPPSYRVMKISRIRQWNLGPGPMCSPTEWAQGVFSSFDVRLPGWMSLVDVAALELALVDLMGGNDRCELDPVKLDALAEFLAHLQGDPERGAKLLAEMAAELVAAPALPQVLIDLDAHFRPGLPTSDSDLRAKRVDVLRRYVEILEPIALKVLNQFTWRLDSRERAAAKRHPLMEDPELAPDPDRQPALTLTDDVRQAAKRVLDRTDRELTPQAAKALRSYLATRGKCSRSRVAMTVGISPQTVSRAIEKLREIVAEENGVDGDAERRAFLDALCAAA